MVGVSFRNTKTKTPKFTVNFDLKLGGKIILQIRPTDRSLVLVLSFCNTLSTPIRIKTPSPRMLITYHRFFKWNTVFEKLRSDR